jgi:DNA-3-methyladenine glycosylase
LSAGSLSAVQPEELIDPIAAAKCLLGAYLVRDFQGKTLIGKIVETEAYFEQDEASHSYRGKTPRTEVMFGPAGHAYVYFSYGVHWCVNVTAGEAGHGAAVLIRALEPTTGIETMRELRMGRAKTNVDLANGPGKLAQALAIDKTLYGHDLRLPPLQLFKAAEETPTEIATSSRIGISKAVDAPLRFYIKDSKYVSRK